MKGEEAEQHFENLKKLLANFHPEIPPAEKRGIYAYAINYCIIRISQRDNAAYYVEQSLDFYLKGIEEEFLFIRGFLSPWDFKNVVKLAMNLKRYDFTEQFIQENYTKMESHLQEDALHFNLADLRYRQGNYQEAQQHLLQVAYSDIYYGLGARAMLLKIYYETEEEEALSSLLASFSIYLKRNKQIAVNIRDTYLNYTSLLTQICKAKKEKLSKIIEKIQNTDRLINRSWLLQICEDLK